MVRRHRYRWSVCVLLALPMTACSPKPDSASAALAATREAAAIEYAVGDPDTLAPPPAELVYSYDEQLEAVISPPVGWALDPPKLTSQHVHKTWLSPDRRTAYGVIRFRLPIPVSEDLALWGFLREMRKSEGEATLLEKNPDRNLPGLRFVAEGGKYTVRTNLTVRGFRGWCVYAGTLRAQPISPEDLHIATQAREATRPGSAGEMKNRN